MSKKIKIFLISFFSFIGLVLVAYGTIIYLATQTWDRFAKSQAVQVRVYMEQNQHDDTLSDKDYHKIYNQIKEVSNAQTIKFSSKDEQLKILSKNLGSDFSLMNGASNPLYDVYYLSYATPEDAKEAVVKIDQINGVEAASEGEVNSNVTLFQKIIYFFNQEKMNEINSVNN